MNSKEDSFSTIDMDRLHAFFGNNNTAIKEFIVVFINSATQELSKIEIAIQHQDEKAAKYAFHKLKGSAINSGFKKIHALCQTAEEKISAADWTTIDKLYLHITDALEEIRAESANKLK